LTVDEPRPLTGEFSATVDDLRDHNPISRLRYPSCLSRKARDLGFVRTVSDWW
jgi:hypothetical protein